MIQRQHLCFALLLLIGFVGLTGCGQKGPLYLPDDAPATSFTETQS